MLILRSSFLLLAGLLVAGCGGDSFEGTETDPAGGAGGSSGDSGGGAGGSSAGSSGGGGKAQGGTGGVASGAGGVSGGGSSAGGSSAGGASGQAGISQAGGKAGGGGPAAGSSPGGAGQGGAGQGGSGEAGMGGMSGAGGTGECIPDTFSCLGDVLRKCDAIGEWVKKEACNTGLCDDSDPTQGKCLVCKPGAVKECSSDKEQNTCTLDGAGFAPVACAKETPFCVKSECVACVAPTDCPTPNNPCLEASCIAGGCGTSPLAEGTLLPDAQQLAQDCNKAICDGQGSPKTVPDDTDLPPDSDSLDCILPACSMGMSTSGFADLGTPCRFGGDQNKGVCQGDSLCGACLPGVKTCYGNTLETCPTGFFVDTKCDPATPVCSVDACVAVSHLAAGERHTCALLSNGAVTCWGDNSAGQLGITDGSNVNFNKTVEVTGLMDAKAIAAGGNNTCAIRANGKVVCWGNNDVGQLGGGDKIPGASTTPVEVLGLDQVISLSVGNKFACAVAGANKEVFCWGSNGLLQLGSAGVSKSNTAIKIDSLSNDFRQVVAGYDHACALTNGGFVHCWGNNQNGQCGKSNGFFNLPPTQIASLSGVESVGTGWNHSCAITNNGATCWGDNKKGQLGIGMTSQYQLPSSTNFGFLTNPAMVGGSAFTCVLSMGKVQCVGGNEGYQLGGGTASESMDPVLKPISATESADGKNPVFGVAEIVAGGSHACVLKTSGDVLCWGNNPNSQLGIEPFGIAKTSVAQPVKWSL